MVFRLPAGTPVNIEKFGITHFMRIPYVTRYSKTQLHQALERIAHDPIATALPKQCWRHPEQLHFLITKLRLDSAKRVKKACQLLRDVSARYREVLCLDPNDFTAVRHSEENPIRPDLRQHLPPSIALYGLLESNLRSPHYPKEAKALFCHVKEAHPFFVDFSSRIGDIFAANGLVPVINPKDDPLRVSIMQTSSIESDVRNRKPSLREHQRYKAPVFDASDLHANHPWTTEFPLERMCISEFRLRDVWKHGKFVRTAFKDIVSVPLPGVSQDVVDVDDPDEDYVKRKYIMTPLAPLRIPSTPSS